MHSRKTIILAVVTILVVYSFAYGCDCLTLNSEESFREAESVFIGRVVSIEPLGFKYKVSFEVKRSLKGDPARYISLDQSATNCDVQFVQGWNYLVYANRFNDGELFASSCSRTQPYNLPRCGNSGQRGFRYFERRITPGQFSLGEIALITAVSVSLSLSLGFVVTRLWRKWK